METIEIEVTELKFPREPTAKSGFVVFTFSNNAGLSGMAKGAMSHIPQPLDRLKLYGDWIIWNGLKQFAFKRWETSQPADERAMLHYVCSKARGFGEVAEAKIWQAKAEKWRDLQAGEVAGITEEKIKIFRQTIIDIEIKHEESVQIAGLLAMGLTDNMAAQAWEMWKPDAVGVIRTNPYRLIELPNYGFVAVDNQRGKFGVADDDSRRIEAAFEWQYRQLSQRGDTVVDGKLLANETAMMLVGVATDKLIATARHLIECGKLIALDEGYVSRKKDFIDELKIWRFAHGRVSI